MDVIHPENAVYHPQVDEYGLPENPFAPPAEQPRPPVRRSRAARNAAQTAAQGPQFDAPVSPEVPDWLKTARQNNEPQDRLLQRPRVQAAPRTPAQLSAYEQAGYPKELLEEQRRMEQAQAAQPMYRRHGAQYAQRPQYQPAPPPQPTGMSYPPPRMQQQAPAVRQRAQQTDWQVETEEEELERELPEWVRKAPWLGMAVFAAVMAVVVLWVMGMKYENQTLQILDERAAQEAKIADSHPLRYEALIAEKSEKYNLSPAFIAAIMLNESSFRADATAESTGARGLMQLMDDTAEWIHGKMDIAEPYRFDSMYEPDMNAEFGCWYLHYLSDLFGGDPVLVAAAFHAGQGEVRNWLNTAAYSPDGRTVAIDKIPFSDTRRYVTRVMNAYAAYLRIYYGG